LACEKDKDLTIKLPYISLVRTNVCISPFFSLDFQKANRRVLAMIERSRSCMEKTLISVEEFPIPAVGKRQRDRRKRCSLRGNLATHAAVFKVEGASLVERYCNVCVKGLKYRDGLFERTQHNDISSNTVSYAFSIISFSHKTPII
jgi:hypothetical protein